MPQIKTKFEDSLFYQIHACGKFFDMLFNQFFKELNVGVNALEHLSLTVINETDDCCQRDLARIILKDRANCGKLANSLEKRGLIKVELRTKNNRPVKILTLTQAGKKILEETRKIIIPLREKIIKEMSYEVMNETSKNLQKFRETVKDAMKNKI